jgi:hypothetical protein
VDDLPDPAYDQNYVHVLTDEEQLDLHKRWSRQCQISYNFHLSLNLEQEKFQRHQTWYRAHGTETHRVSFSQPHYPKSLLSFRVRHFLSSEPDGESVMFSGR